MNRFTSDELAIAKSVDLVDVASHLGFTPKKIGRFYTLKEMDSIRIYDRSHWFRWSMKDVKGHNGGSQIDFLKEFAGLDVKGAVFWLLDFAGYQRSEPMERNGRSSKSQSEANRQDDRNLHGGLQHQVSKVVDCPKREFSLPDANENNDRAIAYLNQKRKISMSTIQYFLDRGLIYENCKYHNVVFKGTDADGIVRFASMRGTYDQEGKKTLKIDVTGSDKNYGFNLAAPDSNVLFVFEGAIDLISYLDMFQKFDANMLALGMVSDPPLERFLKDHPDISFIFLCLDNDEAGRTATERLTKKYNGLGYQVSDYSAPEKYKDINEWLVASKTKIPCRENCITKR